MTLDGHTADNSLDKANLLNEFFYRSFNEKTYPIPDMDQFNNDNLNFIQFSHEDILKVLSNLDTSKAIGPDGLSAVFLKGCASSLSESLTYLFNLSMRTGKIPSSWKLANVVPVFKKGNKKT